MKGTLQSGSRRLHIGDKPLNHYSGTSCFAEYAVVSETSLVQIDPDVPLEDAAAFGCAVITGVGAVVNAAKVSFGSSVAVVGLGGVGLSALLGAHAAGAARIIAIDVSDNKLHLARELGATDTFNARDPNCVQAVRDATSGGVLYAIEAVGARLHLLRHIRSCGAAAYWWSPDFRTRSDLPGGDFPDGYR